MSYQAIRTELRGRTLLIWLHRPDRLNAFTTQMADELEAEFKRVAADDAVAAVIVTGSGRAFCAGMDLGANGNVFGFDEALRPSSLDEARQRLADPQFARGFRDPGGRVTLAVLACPKPVIAAINGPAIGVGATMTLAMDARLVADQARIGFVFGRLGIVPESCSTWLLPRIVGLPTALEWFYSGELIGSELAVSTGLVKGAFPQEELLDQALSLAERFTGGRSTAATALTRLMTYRNVQLSDPFEAHLAESMALYYTSMADGKEGVRAFLEKRRPSFDSHVPADLPPMS